MVGGTLPLSVNPRRSHGGRSWASASGRECEYVFQPESSLTSQQEPAGNVAPTGAMLSSLNLMGDRHGIQRQRTTSRALEQGRDRRPEGAIQGKDIWALRVRLQMESRFRELALFNLGIDSKLRGCDLVSLKGAEQTEI